MGKNNFSWSGKNTGRCKYKTLAIAWIRKYLFYVSRYNFPPFFFPSFLVSLIVHDVFNEVNSQENIYKYISVITSKECTTEQVLQTDTETCGNRKMKSCLQRTSEIPIIF